jgi:hypothetical protein
MLAVAIAAAAAVLITFVFTTLIHEPASMFTLLGVVALSVALEFAWRRSNTATPAHPRSGTEAMRQ